MPLNVDKNVDSAEYANIVLTFTRFYDQARRAGMPALPASSRALAQQWIKRVISGYWTHSGYMNWDSGLGFDRWHQGKKFGLTQEALIGVATGAAVAAPRARVRALREVHARPRARVLRARVRPVARTACRTRCSSTSTPCPRATAPPGSPWRA